MAGKSVFLVAGDEEFLRQDWIQKTRQAFFKDEKESGVDFNLFYANDAEISEALETVKTKPFLNKRRLVVIKNIECLKTPFQQERLLAYAKSPSSHAVLILEADLKEKDLSEDKFLAALKKVSDTVFFKKIYDKNLSAWVTKRFIFRKKKTGSGVVEFLMQLKGNNLKSLDQEIEKLCIYAGTKDFIAKEDVQRLVGRDITSRLDDIFDAISRNEKERALSIGFDFQKKDMGNVVGLFCWSLRRLFRIKECLDENRSKQEIENRLGLKKGFPSDRLINQARRIKVSWIKKALSELTEFDLKIKTSSLRELDFDWQMLLVRLLASL